MRAKRLFAAIIGTGVILSSFLLSKVAYGQIQLVDREVRVVQKNWLCLTHRVELRLSWKFDTKEKTFPASYEVLYRPSDQKSEKTIVLQAADTTHWNSPEISIGDSLFVKVYALDQNGIKLDSLRVLFVPGRSYSQGPQEEKVSFWWNLYGRLFLLIIGKPEIYDHSTIIGKSAFAAEFYLFVLGLFLLIFQTGPVISFFNVGGKKLDDVEKSVAEWERFMDEVRKQASNTDSPGNGNESYLRWWNGEGRRRLEKIKNKLYKLGQKYGKEREPGFFAWFRGLYSRNRKFKRHFGPPIIEVLLAGVQNHLNNGSRGVEASEEIDRAMENRANSELSRVEDLSKIEWLWAIAALAPLLGLLGTVTGLSQAFENLAMRGAATQAEMIPELSKGIFEALWTTILGLGIGILFSILYYYVRNRIDHAFAKIQDIYVRVSEKL